MMKRIDVEWNGEEYTFRTNKDGSYLFTGISVNNQISCESGFHNQDRMKKAIREYLRSKWESDFDNNPTGEAPMPRIKYIPKFWD
jgi:hypothetical protein